MPLTELRDLIRSQPFKRVDLTDDRRLAVTFTRGSFVGKIEHLFPTPKGGVELVGVGDRYVLLVWKIIGGKPPTFPMTKLEKEHGVVATTRFFGMLEKLVQFADKT